MIHRLPEEVVRKIAAGEVVVGAFSVVKELVENSLDAGARRIDIEMKRGGKDYIRVADDGVGMSEEDVILAIQPHTTSKIRDIEDLYRIETYGFRGEALSSIVRVSRCVITTRREEDELATRLYVEGGKIKKVEKATAKVGTTVIVRDLFFNVPARRKFLKSASIEGRMVVETVQKFILSRPDVHFTLIRDGEVVYNAPPSDLLARISLVLPDVSKGIVEVEGKEGYVRVRGAVSRVGMWRKTRSGQFFFVNGRAVISTELSKALEKAYGEALPKGLHPVAVIFIDLPPDKLDVNVHPQKTEVKFSEPELVTHAVYEVVRNAVSKTWKREMPRRKVTYEIPKVEKETLKEPLKLLEAERSLARVEPKVEGKWKFLMTLRDRYIVAEDGESLMIVDYHAAHERILYERLKKTFEEGKMDSVNLLSPLSVPLDGVLISVAEENRDLLERFGFSFEKVEGGVVLKSIPSILPLSQIEGAFREILEDLRLVKLSSIGDVIEKILADMACKSAVRTGDRIDPDSAVELLNEIERMGLTSCPHGRPLVYRITFRELDRYFGRE